MNTHVISFSISILQTLQLFCHELGCSHSDLSGFEPLELMSPQSLVRNVDLFTDVLCRSEDEMQ